MTLCGAPTSAGPFPQTRRSEQTGRLDVSETIRSDLMMNDAVNRALCVSSGAEARVLGVLDGMAEAMPLP